MARDNQVKTYLDDDEAQLVEQAADALDVSTSELLRQAALEQITDDDSLPHAELAEKRRRADQLRDEIDALEDEIEEKEQELEDVEGRIEELEAAVDAMDDAGVTEAESYDEALERIADTVITDDDLKLSPESADVRDVADAHDKDTETVVRDVYQQHPRVSRRDVHARSTSVRPREWMREYGSFDMAVDELVAAREDDVDDDLWNEMVEDVLDVWGERGREGVLDEVERRMESA